MNIPSVLRDRVASFKATTGTALIVAAPPIRSPALKRLMESEIGFEFFRSLDTELALISDSRKQAFVTLSVAQGDGRSTVALLFALQSATLARHLKVLYIDAGADRHHLGRHLDAGENAPCFYDLLEAGAGAGVNFTHTVGPSWLGNLSLVRGGSATRERALFSADRFSTFITEMRRRFDRVIIDPPPLESHREVLAMVKAVPEVLLVSRCRRTSRYRLRLALRDLAWVQARVLGQVLNRRAYPFSL